MPLRRQARARSCAAFAAAGVASLLLLAACSRKPVETAAAAATEPIAVALAPASSAAVDRTLPLVGTLFGDEELTITAKVSGRVVKIAKDVGDRVDFGELVAQIDPTEPELAVTQAKMALQEALARLGLEAPPAADFDVGSLPTVEQARLQAANAEERFRRLEALFTDQGQLVSQQDFNDARMQWDVARNGHQLAMLIARAQLATARLRQAELATHEYELAQTAVRAPDLEEVKASVVATGIEARPAGSRPRYAVAMRRVAVGEHATEGMPLFDLVADDPLKFEGQVPERSLAEVKIGQTAAIETDGAAPVQGKVVRIHPQVEKVNRTFGIEMAVPNPQGALRPGSFAKASLTIATDPAALFVPEDAVVRFLGTQRVFTVADGKAVEHVVKTGVRRDGRIEIVSGLDGVDAQVVVAGASRLSDGTPVAVKDLAVLRGEPAGTAHPSGSK